MTTENIVLILISCLGLIQAILLAVYLFTLRDRQANVLLALMLLGLIIRVGKSIFNTYMPMDSWARNLGISGILITGPFLWFYGRALFEKRSFITRDYFHLIPFGLFILLSAVIPNRADFASLLIYSLVLCHLAVYLIMSWTYLTTKLEGARLQPWYRNIVAGVTVIWFLYLGIFIGFIPLYILSAIVFSFLIYLFSYLLLKRHVFALEKYGNSTVGPEISKQMLLSVKQLFEEKHVYEESTISLKSVAEQLSISPRDLSQAINEHTQMNFSEFVNQYRVEKAKTLLANPTHSLAKIESIAYDCGFGNVTSFNVAFKASTRMTPSQYRSQFAAV